MSPRSLRTSPAVDRQPDGEEIHSKIVYKHVGETRVATKTRRRKIRSEEEARVATERIKRRVRFVQDDVHDDTKKTK